MNAATRTKLDSLKNGREVMLSGRKDRTWISAVRSGNGKEIRLMRNTKNGFDVIQRIAFQARYCLDV